MFHILNDNHCWVSNIKPVLKKCVMKIVFFFISGLRCSWEDYFFSSSDIALGWRQSLNIFPFVGFSHTNPNIWKQWFVMGDLGSPSKGLLFLLCLKYLQRKISDIRSKSDNVSGPWHNPWRQFAWSPRGRKEIPFLDSFLVQCRKLGSRGRWGGLNKVGWKHRGVAAVCFSSLIRSSTFTSRPEKPRGSPV